MDTFKGAGIDFMEDDYHWHYGALDAAKEKQCYDSLDKYYAARVHVQKRRRKQWQAV